MTPMISVAIPVKNGAAFLAEAIESILTQSYEDFELLVLDDHSDDETAQIVRQYMHQDARVRLLEAKHHGLVAGLNQLLKASRGKYFARMDADDVAEPYRLEKQVIHLEQCSDCDILGCWVNVIGDKQEVWHYRRTFADTATVLLMGKTPLCHPSIMGRIEVMRQLGYRSEYLHMEDMDLFARAFSEGIKFYALPEVLLHYRVHPKSVSTKNERFQMSQRALIVKDILNSTALKYDERLIDPFIRSVSYGESFDKATIPLLKQYMSVISESLIKIGINESEEWQKKQRWLEGVDVNG